MYAGDTTITGLIGDVQDAAVPELRAVAVTTLTGATTVHGRSGDLGNDTDHALLNALRDWADVVVIGARTATVENYFGVRTSPEQAAARTSRGQAPVAPVAVISRDLSLGPHTQLFTNTFTPPLILLPHASLTAPELTHRRDLLTAAGATLVSTGPGSAEDIVAALHSLGHRRITCEGGPGLYSQLFRADLVDVLHLTVDPVLHSPADMQLLRGDVHRRLALDHLAATADGTVFLRYRRNLLG